MFDADFPAIENIYNLSYFYITFIQLFEKIAVPLQPSKKSQIQNYIYGFCE